MLCGDYFESDPFEFVPKMNLYFKIHVRNEFYILQNPMNEVYNFMLGHALQKLNFQDGVCRPSWI